MATQIKTSQQCMDFVRLNLPEANKQVNLAGAIELKVNPYLPDNWMVITQGDNPEDWRWFKLEDGRLVEMVPPKSFGQMIDRN
jgi:hypothetical protein